MDRTRPLRIAHSPAALRLLLALTLQVAAASAAGAAAPGPSAGSGAVDAVLARAEDDGFSGVVLVLRAGTVAHLRGLGETAPGSGVRNDADTVVQLASVGKAFTAAAVLALARDGRLQLDASIADYLPAVPRDKRAITVHQLLVHTSGLPHRVGRCGTGSADLDRDAYVRMVLAAPLAARPGARHRYSNDGYGLLGAIIERAAGEPLEVYLRRALFEPARMQHTGLSLPAGSHAAHGTGDGRRFLGNLDPAFRRADGPAWCNRASGGLLSTANDMARWLTALRSGAVLDGTALGRMLSPHVADPSAAGTTYGYGWALTTTPRGRLAAHDGSLSGYYTADLRWYLDDDLALFVAANDAAHPADVLADALARVLAPETDRR